MRLNKHYKDNSIQNVLYLSHNIYYIKTLGIAVHTSHTYIRFKQPLQHELLHAESTEWSLAVQLFQVA